MPVAMSANAAFAFRHKAVFSLSLTATGIPKPALPWGRALEQRIIRTTLTWVRNSDPG